jgi:hypothetical protein
MADVARKRRESKAQNGAQLFANRPQGWGARVRYRLRQFWRGLGAQIDPAARARAVALLPAAARPLFAAMPRDAQRHSLNVLQTLHGAGQHDPDLAVAALLHDVGKIAVAANGMRLGLWLRGPLVLLEAAAPSWLARLARPQPEAGWRYLCHVHLAHAEIGAAWAADGGCTPLSCWLIACHQTPLAAVEGGPMQKELLAALQWADGMN